MENLKNKKGQSVLEYILVSLAFATAGFLLFISTNIRIFLNTNIGIRDKNGYNYQGSLVGKILKYNTINNEGINNNKEDITEVDNI